VRVFMIAVMIKGKFEESALLGLSCTFRGMDHCDDIQHRHQKPIKHNIGVLSHPPCSLNRALCNVYPIL
jgi:hypothetical protein